MYFPLLRVDPYETYLSECQKISWKYGGPSLCSQSCLCFSEKIRRKFYFCFIKYRKRRLTEHFPCECFYSIFFKKDISLFLLVTVVLYEKKTNVFFKKNGIK